MFEIVPLIAPVKGLRDRPRGSDPDAIAQVEELQLFAASVVLITWPFVKGPSVVGLMEQVRADPEVHHVAKLGL